MQLSGLLPRSVQIKMMACTDISSSSNFQQGRHGSNLPKCLIERSLDNQVSGKILHAWIDAEFNYDNLTGKGIHLLNSK